MCAEGQEASQEFQSRATNLALVAKRLWPVCRPRHAPDRSPRRDGFSLLEVIVLIAVLFGGVIALAQLASTGRQHAQRAARITTAQILCQNKLNEIVAGIVPLAPVTEAPFPESPDWKYTIDVESTWNGLLSVKVSVFQSAESDVPEPARARRAISQPNTPRYSLVRWLRPIQNVHQDLGGDDNAFQSDNKRKRKRKRYRQRREYRGTSAMNLPRNSIVKPGFTLVEVMISASLGAVLLVGLWTVFDIFSALQERAGTQSRHAQLTRGLLHQLLDDLNRVTMPAASTGREQTRTGSTIPAADSTSGISPGVETTPAHDRDPNQAEKPIVFQGSNSWIILDLPCPADGEDKLVSAANFEGQVSGIWETVPSLRRVIYQFVPPELAILRDSVGAGLTRWELTVPPPETPELIAELTRGEWGAPNSIVWQANASLSDQHGFSGTGATHRSPAWRGAGTSPRNRAISISVL